MVRGHPDRHRRPGRRRGHRSDRGRPPTTGTRAGLVVDVAERLAVFLAAHAPPGRLATTRGAEARLARACVVLTDWETAYRTGQLPDHVAPLYTDPDTTVPDLLAAVPDHQVAELVDLAARADRADRADRAGILARLARGISGPVFVELLRTRRLRPVTPP